ncbi:MAG: MotA/TolQ/ExbB proton channel family protein [Pseudomonadota bacterium]
MEDGLDTASTVFGGLWAAVAAGGPVIWAIALLSVIALATILWKITNFMSIGAWGSSAKIDRVVGAWCSGQTTEALQAAQGLKGMRGTMVKVAMASRLDTALDEDGARDETGRMARMLLARAGSGVRLLELISTVAPLLGLLGTVLGMIAAFQALQIAGTRADPSDLAGGIWEALLTTAAGMAVAIPAAMAVTWFESVIDKLRLDLEDIATRVFVRPVNAQSPNAGLNAAE